MVKEGCYYSCMVKKNKKTIRKRGKIAKNEVSNCDWNEWNCLAHNTGRYKFSHARIKEDKESNYHCLPNFPYISVLNNGKIKDSNRLPKSYRFDTESDLNKIYRVEEICYYGVSVPNRNLSHTCGYVDHLTISWREFEKLGRPREIRREVETVKLIGLERED